MLGSVQNFFDRWGLVVTATLLLLLMLDELENDTALTIKAGFVAVGLQPGAVAEWRVFRIQDDKLSDRFLFETA